MKRRTRGARAAALVGLMASAGIGSEAAAAIPYDTELTPGQLRAIPWEFGDPWPTGYIEYLPANYDMVPADHLYPLLVTLGGIGTMDMPSNCPGNADWCTAAECDAAGAPDGICRAMRRGPSVEINDGSWNDVQRPFIVISIQNFATTSSTTDYDRDVVDAMVTFAIDNYPVDPRRMYLLGNSQGGRATMQYTALYSRRMAAVTIGPGGVVAETDAACLFQDTAFWAFHGENDDDANIGVGVFDPCLIVQQVRMYLQPDQYPALPGCVARVGTPIPEARMTMFDDTAHNAWTPAFENITNGFGRSTWSNDQFCGYSTNFYDYDAAMDPDGVYGWLLSFDRPETDAGDDFAVPGDQVQFDLVADTLDDDPVSYAWTQLDGPPVTLTNADQATATVTDFAYDQVYTFEVYALDADQQWDVDEVVVTVEAEVVSSDSSGGSDSDGSSSSGDGDGTTTGGPGPATTSGNATAGDATAGDTTAGDATAGGGTSGPVPPGGDDVGSTGGGEGSSGGIGTAGAGDGGSGCGCRTQPRGGGGGWGGWSGLMALAGLMARRRRRA